MRPIPVMLALLLALSPGAVALQASAPTAPASDVADAEQTDAVPGQIDSVPEPTDTGTVQSTPNENTTVVMTLGTEPMRTAFDSPSLALGSSLAMSRDGFETQLSVNVLNHQLEAAETAEKKKQVLNRYRYQIENQIISLKAKERRVTNELINGTITEREYLRTLGYIDVRAEETRNAIEAMRTRSKDIPRFNLETEANTLKGKLVTVEGPVRDRIGRVLRGEVPPTKMYVSTSETGVVLSTIAGNTHVREIVRKDRRDPSATPNISPIEAQDLVLDHYSWAKANLERANTFRYGSTNIISVSVNHPHGDLVAHVDSGTEAVFKEVQHKRLTGENSLPPGPGTTNATENVTVTVNRTYPGGPLKVQLTNSTGAPLDGQITVAGEPVGRTHDDGVLWTLGPAQQFRVSATYEDTTVNVTATPVENESAN